MWVGGILRTCAAIAKNLRNSSSLVCPAGEGDNGRRREVDRFPHRLSKERWVENSSTESLITFTKQEVLYIEKEPPQKYTKALELSTKPLSL